MGCAKSTLSEPATVEALEYTTQLQTDHPVEELIEADSEVTSEVVPYRVGEWLPSDQKVLDTWLGDLVEEVDDINGSVEDVDAPNVDCSNLHPVILEFKELIESEADINMFFHQMFSEVPKKFTKSPSGRKQVRHYLHMLQLVNQILNKAPEFNETGLVGFPINAILDWSMGTTAGYAAFLNDRVNSQLKKVLNHWGTFLKSSQSCYVLNKDPKKGWFGTDAMKKMKNFEKEFKCDPTKEHYGYTSWDDFFTREFRDRVRPIADPDDENVIVNACESAPYKLQYHVKRRDKFWIKAQPYSLEHMLANDPLVDEFDGGIVYQAFLSALSYHRWHSPVDGTIYKTNVQDGSYYSETLSEGFDSSGPNESQGYITEVATRALVFIKADNPHIGLMCFMAIGMAEVSSCEITVYEGERVSKGQQIGMFHFGGSSHCLIFRPGLNITFDLHGQKPSLNSNNIPVNSKIATVQND